MSVFQRRMTDSLPDDVAPEAPPWESGSEYPAAPPTSAMDNLPSDPAVLQRELDAAELADTRKDRKAARAELAAKFTIVDERPARDEPG